MTDPERPQLSPYQVELEAGKRYAWCRCGRSQKQPFCDGSHAGTGIEPEHADRLFKAFFTTKHGGMGMGLSICRSIIEAHGGRMSATNNPGLGATFQFTLPSSATGEA